MKVLFNDLLIVRDPNFHIPRKAPQWEIPVLQEIYGQGEVVIGEEFEHEMSFTDIPSEFARLANVYGREEDSKIPYVEVVYGRGPAGVKAFEKAVRQAAVTEVRRGRPPKVESTEADAA